MAIYKSLYSNGNVIMRLAHILFVMFLMYNFMWMAINVS